MAADGVDLLFEPEALTEIAQEAMGRRTGARALRSILEETMTNVMFDVPSLSGVAQCIISQETIKTKTDPILISRTELLAQAREKAAQNSLPEIEQIEQNLEADEPAEAA